MWATIGTEMLDIINTFCICVNELKNLMEPFPAALHAARLGCLTEQPSYQALESG